MNLGEQPYENLFQDYQQPLHFLLRQSTHTQYGNQYNQLRLIPKQVLVSLRSQQQLCPTLSVEYGTGVRLVR